MGNMRVFVDPLPSTLSQAMHRVSAALRRHHPADVTIVDEAASADVQVLHAIGPDVAEQHLVAPEYAVLQYCVYSAGGMAPWSPLWQRARAVWSYYDLAADVGSHFYLAPLGVDGTVFRMPATDCRDDAVMTSGYVSGPGAEAIEEVAIAAERAGLTTVHLGPSRIVNMRHYPASWCAVHNIPDPALAALYRRCRWVSGLRRVEGFELPVLEGLACGCRPVVFDRPDMRRWYDGHAAFVPEVEGAELIDHLTALFRTPPAPVTPDERAAIIARFDWATVTAGFWSAIRRGRMD